MTSINFSLINKLFHSNNKNQKSNKYGKKNKCRRKSQRKKYPK